MHSWIHLCDSYPTQDGSYSEESVVTLCGFVRDSTSTDAHTVAKFWAEFEDPARKIKIQYSAPHCPHCLKIVDDEPLYTLAHLNI